MTFVLDPRLAADSDLLATWDLCQVRLQDDARYPWLVLVPQREGLREVHDLMHADRHRLAEEIARATAAVAALGVHKVNVGALGNIVEQLHVHVVGRMPGDPAWPGPVWGQGSPVRRAPAARAALEQQLAHLLEL
ncbi:HIT domain-containing protein [Zavarzinia sp. CC-PAN008]|uniref:HIT domain-containing protein n=1 Tax=Zavarzinia sp. CC-PAN008 TaxID=3243332 RepID=UPI003F746755